MGRRGSGIEGLIFGMAKATVRTAIKAHAAHQRDIARYERESIAAARSVEKAKKDLERRNKQIYESNRMLEAIQLARDAAILLDYFNNGVIPEILDSFTPPQLEALKPEYNPPSYVVPDNLRRRPAHPIEINYISAVGKSPMLGIIFPAIKLKWQNSIERAKEQYLKDLHTYNEFVQIYDSQLAESQNEFQKELEIYNSDYQKKCVEIEEFKAQYLNHDQAAVISYNELVIDSSSYFIDWMRDYDIAYSKESKELLIEYRLPNIDIIPSHSDYKYIKILDKIEPKLRRKAETESCYKSLISGIALRTIYEVLKSDEANAISILSFNGYVVAENAVNGQMVSPTLISVLISKAEFENIKFDRIIPIECIKGLSALITTSPYELIAVKPMREYSMVDKRFVLEEDIISTLDKRPNLMDLDPFEFENLVSNLFSKMGLEVKQTRSTKDSGVDAIAFDTRPIIGGKIVIQAKRYKNTVGVSAVRDLYGTMMNEGASKGVLVTTSSYGGDAYVFSKNKPIELIDGGNLLYLLQQVGINAKIVMPDTWEY